MALLGWLDLIPAPPRRALLGGTVLLLAIPSLGLGLTPLGALAQDTIAGVVVLALAGAWIGAWAVLARPEIARRRLEAERDQTRRETDRGLLAAGATRDRRGGLDALEVEDPAFSLPVFHDIVRARAGADNAAFGRLVELHQSRVRGFLRRLCHNGAEADDLAQETFLIAYKKLSTYNASGEFGGWLCSIAYRCFLQHQRGKKRKGEIDVQFAATQEFESDRYYAISAEQIDLERAMQHIEQHEAAAITLNLTLGFSHSEVADIMQLPLGTVKSHINRGLQKLRAIIRPAAVETGT